MHLQPRFTLADVFGDNVALLSVPALEPYGFLNPHGAPGRMATRLALAGSLPLFCHESLLQKRWLDFHRDAGLPSAGNPLPYRDRDHLQMLLDTRSRRQRSLLLDYLYPPGRIPENAHFVERALVASLNNKADLAFWAGPAPVPPRQIVRRQELLLHPERFFHDASPVYLKGVSDGPSGAGIGVRYAVTPAEASQYTRVFSSCSHIVVEPSRPFKATFCLNYLIFSSDHIQYLGAGEQVIKHHAVYAGNWFDPQRPPPSGAVADGMRIAQRAAAAGYMGIAGMDVGILPDGDWEFLDLNFRTNGSTAPLLFLPAVCNHLKYAPIALTCPLTPASLSADALLFLLRQIDAGHLFVLSAHAPDFPDSDPARVNLLVVGTNRHQVEQRLRDVETVLSAKER